MRLRLPRFVADFLMRRGVQDAVPYGDEFISTGAEITETYRGDRLIIMLEISSFRDFFRCLIRRRG